MRAIKWPMILVIICGLANFVFAVWQWHSYSWLVVGYCTGCLVSMGFFAHSDRGLR